MAEWLNAPGQGFGMPADVYAEPASVGALPAEWTTTPDADTGRVIYYLHGGS